MSKLIDMQFVGIEFGFNSEEAITGELIVKVEGENGEVTTITYRTELHDTDLSEILPHSEMEEVVSLSGGLGNLLFKLKRILMFKVAFDLGLEVADTNYTPTLSTQEKLRQLETTFLEISILLAEEQARNLQNEQAILELSMFTGGDE